MQNKTIYLTYKQPLPPRVTGRWKNLYESYCVEFSDDDDCLSFLQESFPSYVATLFQNIPQGMFKADLWRLCKLYLHGGVYADVDLVPYLNMDQELDTSISFTSCLSIVPKSIFQAFMVVTQPRNPLLLHFLVSFLRHKPYDVQNGPPYDMFSIT